MTIVSNCLSCGADSVANPLTGAVTRKNDAGQKVAASVRNPAIPDQSQSFGNDSIRNIVINENIQASKTPAQAVQAYLNSNNPLK